MYFILWWEETVESLFVVPISDLVIATHEIMAIAFYN